jgi:hypothetical protein
MNDSLSKIYQEMGQVVYRVSSDNWDRLVIICPIRSDFCTAIETFEVKDQKRADLDVGFDAIFEIEDFALRLRNDLLETTGSRIWSLTFTLYPTGKFNIDYDYNKPDDYEESDEQITGAQANESLFKLGFRGKSESNE